MQYEVLVCQLSCPTHFHPATQPTKCYQQPLYPLMQIPKWVINFFFLTLQLGCYTIKTPFKLRYPKSSPQTRLRCSLNLPQNPVNPTPLPTLRVNPVGRRIPPTNTVALNINLKKEKANEAPKEKNKTDAEKNEDDKKSKTLKRGCEL